MLTQLIEKNFYIIEITGLSDFVFLFINKDILKTWHMQLCCLGWQNII